jgi:hypothetical protein
MGNSDARYGRGPALLNGKELWTSEGLSAATYASAAHIAAHHGDVDAALAAAKAAGPLSNAEATSSPELHRKIDTSWRSPVPLLARRLTGRFLLRSFGPPTRPRRAMRRLCCGWRPPTAQYSNGYWKQLNKSGQPVDPSTGKPPANVTKHEGRATTHVELPPSKDVSSY